MSKLRKTQLAEGADSLRLKMTQSKLARSASEEAEVQQWAVSLALRASVINDRVEQNKEKFDTLTWPKTKITVT